MISQQIFTPNTLIGFFLLEGSAFNTVELNICSKPDLLPQMEAGKSRNFTAANGGRIFAQVIVVVTHISVYIEIWTSRCLPNMMWKVAKPEKQANMPALYPRTNLTFAGIPDCALRSLQFDNKLLLIILNLDG